MATVINFDKRKADKNREAKSTWKGLGKSLAVGTKKLAIKTAKHLLLASYYLAIQLLMAIMVGATVLLAMARWPFMLLCLILILARIYLNQHLPPVPVVLGMAAATYGFYLLMNWLLVKLANHSSAIHARLYPEKGYK